MKTLKFIIFLIIILQSTCVIAQDIDLEWVINVNGSMGYYGESITVDDLGNTYIAGKFWGTIDFDPSPDTANITADGTPYHDAFLAKYDPDGNYLWCNRMGGNGATLGHSVVIDQSGGVYVTGYFGNSAGFNPTGTDSLYSNGGKDIFIAKYDQNGNYIWAKSMGGTGSDDGKNLVIDGAGNICLVGYFEETANFNPSGTNNLTSSAESDGFLAKYDSNGNYLWAFKVGGNYWDFCSSVVVDDNDNIYIAGEYTNVTDFDPSGSTVYLSGTGGDGFLAKYSPAGNYLWALSIGGIGEDVSRSLVIDNANNVYVTGQFRYTADFDPSGSVANLTSAGDFDIFLAKYDENGDYQWAMNMGGSSYEYGYNVALDSSNNVYVTGDFHNSADFNITGAPAIINSSGGADIFLAKYDTDGNYLWVKGMGGSNHDYGRGLVIDNNQDVLLAGLFEGSVDFDPSIDSTILTSGSLINSDFFIAKYTPSCAFSVNIHPFTLYNKNYQVVKEYRSWTDAAACASHFGGHLVELNSELEQDTVYSEIINGAGISSAYTSVSDGGNIAYVWMGASDLDTEGIWLWDGNNNGSGTNYWNGEGSAGADNGSAVGGMYNNWGGNATYGTPTQPDNDGGNQNAAAMGLTGWPFSTPDSLGSTGEWNDIDTSNSLFYVIEYECIKSVTINTSSCDSYTSPSGKVWTATNTYMDTVATGVGCDSMFTINLVIYNSTAPIQNVEVCYNDQYTYPDGTVETNIIDTTSHISYLSSIISGCDSIITTMVSVLPVYEIDENVGLCVGENYTFPDGSTATNIVIPISHISNLSSVVTGCDSIITTYITVNPVYNNIQNVTACTGDNYTYPDGTTVTGLTQSESYTSTLSSIVSGCDSLITTNITVYPIYSTSDTVELCEGENYIYPDGTQEANITGSTSHVSNLISTSGCDSTITTNITIISGYSITETVELCNGETYIYPDGTQETNITGSTSHVSNLMSISGCDSLITTNITILPGYSITETVELCEGENYTYPDGTIESNITQSTSYTSSLTSVETGCDSTITTNISLTSLDATVISDGTTITANEIGVSYQWYNCANMSMIFGENGQTFMPVATGSYMVEISSNGCSDTSLCEQITIVSVGIINSISEEFIFWPNPTNGTINVSGYTQDINKIELYNTLGERINYTVTVNGSVTTIYFDGPAGIYFLTTETEKVLIIKY